jgi:hypothetical protein
VIRDYYEYFGGGMFGVGENGVFEQTPPIDQHRVMSSLTLSLKTCTIQNLDVIMRQNL